MAPIPSPEGTLSSDTTTTTMTWASPELMFLTAALLPPVSYPFLPANTFWAPWLCVCSALPTLIFFFPNPSIEPIPSCEVKSLAYALSFSLSWCLFTMAALVVGSNYRQSKDPGKVFTHFDIFMQMALYSYYLTHQFLDHILCVFEVEDGLQHQIVPGLPIHVVAIIALIIVLLWFYTPLTTVPYRFITRTDSDGYKLPEHGIGKGCYRPLRIALVVVVPVAVIALSKPTLLLVLFSQNPNASQLCANVSEVMG